MQTELITGGALLIGGVAMAIYAFRKPTDTKTPSQAVVVEQAKSAFINIYDGETLILMNKLDPLIAQCRDRMGFDYAIFKNDCLPLIYKSAEWVQMLPASESHHHAQPGGLVLHMLESASVALRLRQGYLLPVGAAPEEIPERKHRWTYAVFLAALLHDIGRPIADIQVKLKNNALWQPLAGSMLEQGITQYKINFEIKKRDYELHKRLPIILFQRLVPAHVLSWLAQDAVLMQELTSYLSGDSLHDGAIKEIVTKADSESVRQNLLLGPRTRFAAAKTIPLIERLMQALRIMLEEGRFSLNRAGAHGWVWDGKLWFVSKRVADDVRQFLIERESGSGVPGKDKNDRLFDTWQEYGALITTPENKAIWSINVSLDDGWSKDFTVICFSLDKLFAEPSQYPKQVAGRISINVGAVIESEELEQNAPSESPLAGTEVDVESNADVEPENSNTEESKSSVTEPEPELDVSLPVPIKKTNVPEPDNGFSQAKPPSMVVLNTKAIDDVFLDEEDVAKPAPKASKALNSAPIKPITPHDAKGLPAIGKTKKSKGPSAAALKFMRWIQDGLADGSMSYNRADSNIHFTQEGMALVSPRIFKEFAQKFGEDGTGTASDKSPADLGQGIQRHITNTGWHLQVGEKKFNIIKYTVVGQDGNGTKIISTVVIKNPLDFINPVPEINPCIVKIDNPMEGK
jgi:integrating conjugative element relaxase (TIGR03760 family)